MERQELRNLSGILETDGFWHLNYQRRTTTVKVTLAIEGMVKRQC